MNRVGSLSVAVVISCWMVAAPALHGQGWGETKLLPSDGAPSDYFGYAVSIRGRYAAVGASNDDDNGTDSGSVYVFRNTVAGRWIEEQKLLPRDGGAYDSFGVSVSLCKEVAAVGAYGDDANGTDSGSVYLFRRLDAGAWVEECKLLASDGAAHDRFGHSVCVLENLVAVGVPYDDDSGLNCGSAYIFRRTSRGDWVEEAKLIAHDGATEDYFGRSVALSGDRIAVSSHGDDDLGENSGSAYIFRRTNRGDWTEETKLLPADGAAHDLFGRSLSLAGDVVLAGAHGDNDNGTISGAAYVFRRQHGGSWLEEAKLLPSDGMSHDKFGIAVCLSGGRALAVAYYDDDNGIDSGSAYLFSVSSTGTWHQQAKLLPYDGAANDQFGSSASFSEETALIAAYLDDDLGHNSGSAYVFDLSAQGRPGSSVAPFRLMIGERTTLTATHGVPYAETRLECVSQGAGSGTVPYRDLRLTPGGSHRVDGIKRADHRGIVVWHLIDPHVPIGTPLCLRARQGKSTSNVVTAFLRW